LPLSDNRHDDFADPTVRVGGGRVAPLVESKNVLLPGYGHAVLGAGKGDRQVQAHLHFSPFKEAIHTHADGLSLMLWAFGSELYTDIGYHRSKYRPWASTTLSHNTVVVDRGVQNGTSTKGRLLAWAEDGRGRSFVQVEDAGAYGPPVTRYRRTLLLDATDVDGPYVMDVFEVRGGTMHDYALHGPTVFESKAATELALAPLAGERPRLTAQEAAAYDPATHHYGQFTGVRAGTPGDVFNVDFRLTDPYRLPKYAANPRYPTPKSFHYAIDPAAYADRGAIGVVAHFVERAGDEADGVKTEFFLGETPSLLRSGLTGGPLTEKLRRPSMLLRREGGDGLASVFVAVHEPYYRESKIKNVRRLPTTEPGGSALAIVIERADRTDTLLLSLDGETVTAREPSTAQLRGRLGVVSRGAGRSDEGWLVGGTRLTEGDFELATEQAAYEGTIDVVASRWNGDAENAFTTSAVLPEGTAVRGRVLIVHHGGGSAQVAEEGYAIDRVERRGERTVIHLADDPGLRIRDGVTEEIFLPRRKWTGVNRFMLPTVGVR
jgi:hypothetical protein